MELLQKPSPTDVALFTKPVSIPIANKEKYKRTARMSVRPIWKISFQKTQNSEPTPLKETLGRRFGKTYKRKCRLALLSDDETEIKSENAHQEQSPSPKA